MFPPFPTLSATKLNKQSPRKDGEAEIVEFESHTWKLCDKYFGGCWNRTHIMEEPQPGKGHSKNRNPPFSRRISYNKSNFSAPSENNNNTTSSEPNAVWIFSKAEANGYASLQHHFLSSNHHGPFIFSYFYNIIQIYIFITSASSFTRKKYIFMCQLHLHLHVVLLIIIFLPTFTLHYTILYSNNSLSLCKCCQSTSFIRQTHLFILLYICLNISITSVVHNNSLSVSSLLCIPAILGLYAIYSFTNTLKTFDHSSFMTSVSTLSTTHH